MFRTHNPSCSHVPHAASLGSFTSSTFSTPSTSTSLRLASPALSECRICASREQTTPHVFILLQIPHSPTPLFSFFYKCPGGVATPAPVVGGVLVWSAGALLPLLRAMPRQKLLPSAHHACVRLRLLPSARRFEKTQLNLGHDPVVHPLFSCSPPALKCFRIQRKGEQRT